MPKNTQNIAESIAFQGAEMLLDRVKQAVSKSLPDTPQNEGHQKEAARQQEELERARQAGSGHAFGGGKLKANPHQGGSALWWAWHQGYTQYKRDEAREQRRQNYEARRT